MPIQIVKQEEKNTYEVNGSKVYYRRIPNGVQSRIIQRNTRKGKTDWQAVTKEFLEYIIIGWDGVMDGETTVQFDPSMIASLPAEVLNDILDMAKSNDPGDSLKN